MAHMSELDHGERVKRLRELVSKLRHAAAHEGHMLYVLDAIDLIVDELEDQHAAGQGGLDP
jgi:hypothetical protein